MEVSEVLARYQIKKFVLANVAGVSASEVSLYLRDKSCAIRSRILIEGAASDLQMIHDRLQAMGEQTGIFLAPKDTDTTSIVNFVKWCKTHPEPPQSVEGRH